MPFSIPADLGVFSVAGLEDLLRVATDELRTIRASVADPQTVDDDTLARITDLHTFGVAAKDEISRRKTRAAQFATLDIAEEDEEVTEEAADEPVAAEVVTAGSQVAIRPLPSVAQVAVHAPAPNLPVTE